MGRCRNEAAAAAVQIPVAGPSAGAGDTTAMGLEDSAADSVAIAKPHVGPVPQSRSSGRPGTATALLSIRPHSAQRRLTRPGARYTGGPMAAHRIFPLDPWMLAGLFGAVIHFSTPTRVHSCTVAGLRVHSHRPQISAQVLLSPAPGLA